MYDADPLDFRHPRDPRKVLQLIHDYRIHDISRDLVLFRNFIGEDIRLDRVTMRKEDLLKELLEFYMGKNTPERQTFIIDNLVVEDEEVA